MATYTREQIRKWSEKLANGFELDLNRLLMWNEKEPVRHIDLPDGRILEAKIWWNKIYENHRYTGELRPEIHFSIWTRTSTGMLSSFGMGATVEIPGKTVTRKNWNELVKLTAE